MKICTKCIIEKPKIAFCHKNDTPDNLSYHCKECIAIAKHNWYKLNKQKEKENMKLWYSKNKDTRLVSMEKWRNAPGNREKHIAVSKKWKQDNCYNELIKTRRAVDLNFKLITNIRARLRQAIKNNQKAGSAVFDLGCSIEELKAHLESKFQPEMTWDNWGKTGWHIDHIKPLSSFDLTDKTQFLEACSYKNLQPLWAKDNLVKSNKII